MQEFTKEEKEQLTEVIIELVNDTVEKLKAKSTEALGGDEKRSINAFSVITGPLLMNSFAYVLAYGTVMASPKSAASGNLLAVLKAVEEGLTEGAREAAKDYLINIILNPSPTSGD